MLQKGMKWWRTFEYFKYWEQHPIQTLKLSADISVDELQKFFNDVLSAVNFPDNMKLAEITPACKKKDPLKKKKTIDL